MQLESEPFGTCLDRSSDVGLNNSTLVFLVLKRNYISVLVLSKRPLSCGNRRALCKSETMKKSLLPIARRVVSLANTPLLKSRFCCSTSHSSAPPPPSNNKLFVAGLSWSIEEKSLQDAFSEFGKVTEVRIMYDKETGRSRGFGFVHFAKENEAKCAKDAMDGKAFLGRPLRISFALEKVRGGPVVIPRLSHIPDAFGRTS